MSSPLDELEAAALALPREHRARLAKELLDSLDDTENIDTAWKDEVRRRLEAFRSGTVEEVDANEVFEQARDITNR